MNSKIRLTVILFCLIGSAGLADDDNSYLGQLSAMGLLGDLDVGREFLAKLSRSFDERLGYLRSIERQILGDSEPESVDEVSFFDWAALHMGTTALEARVGCCEELLEIVERRAAAATKRKRSAGEGRSR